LSFFSWGKHIKQNQQYTEENIKKLQDEVTLITDKCKKLQRIVQQQQQKNQKLESEVSEQNKKLQTNQETIEILQSNERKLENYVLEYNRFKQNYRSQFEMAIQEKIKLQLGNDDCKGIQTRYQNEINEFFPQKQKAIKVLVVATMSAGKSTLINALVGKRLLKSRNEATTGKIYHILNTPLPNEKVTRYEDQLQTNLSRATVNRIKESTSENEIYLADSFVVSPLQDLLMEILDTPGVNSTVSFSDADVSNKFLENGDFNEVIYVVNAENNGTQDDFLYIKQVKRLIGKIPIIFVLNKLDSFDQEEDSIAQSLEALKQQLNSLGIVAPKIISVSARAALLSKLQLSGQKLTLSEQQQLQIYEMKFNTINQFNLEEQTANLTSEKNSAAKLLLHHSGITNLEKAIIDSSKKICKEV
jgi:small GTP-binding protein